MNDLERRLIEDRALRDSALRLFRSDLQVIREDLRERPVSARISSRLGDAAMDVLDEAVDYADDNRGKVAAAVAAVVVWFARKPLLGALADLLDPME